jgi:hypothetical protein
MRRGTVFVSVAVALVTLVALRQPIDANSPYDATLLGRWWKTWVITSLIGGLAVGAIGGELALRKMSYRYTETPLDFLNRVRLRGFLTGAVAALTILAAASGFAAAFRDLTNATPADRWMALLLPRGVAFMGLSYVLAWVGYAGMTGFREWGGQYALLPSRWFTGTAARGA